MAYTPGSGAYAQGDLSVREDLSDQIADIDVLETHVSSTSPTVPVTNKIHSWVSDPLTAVTSQVGTPEFADTTFAATNPTTLLNVTQIIEYGVAVSGTDMNSKHAAIGDKFAREKLKKMKQWKNQLEFSVVAGAAATATGTAQRKMAGIASYASTNKTGHTSVSLTSDMLNEYMRHGYDVGARYDNCLVGSVLKQRISSFTSPNTRNVDAGTATVVYRVDIYDSDFGRIEIHPHQYINKAFAQTQYGMLLYQSDCVHVGVMDAVHYEDRAITGYYKPGSIVGEYTVEANNELGFAYHWGLL